MRTVRISDVTIKNAARGGDNALSFREKLELSKLLDRLGVSAIETAVIVNRCPRCGPALLPRRGRRALRPQVQAGGYRDLKREERLP